MANKPDTFANDTNIIRFDRNVDLYLFSLRLDVVNNESLSFDDPNLVVYVLI